MPPRLCAAAVAALGAAALLGWATGFSWLTTFGAGKIPMAPSTALFFLGFGLGALLLAAPEPGRWWRWAAMAGTACATAAVLLLGLFSWQGVHLRLEHLGLVIGGTLGGVPLGHMSPLTAFCFFLAGLSLLGGLAAVPRRRWPAMAAFGSASLCGLVSFALLLAYLLGAPLLYGSGVIPPALTTSLAFFLLALSFQLATLRRAWPAAPRAAGAADPAVPHVLLLIFAVLAVGIVTAGFLDFRNHQRDHHAGAAKQLAAIATLKAERIAAWLAERQAAGEELAGNQGFAERLARWLEHGDAAARDAVVQRLGSRLAASAYEGMTLLGADGRPRFGLGDQPDLAPLAGLAGEAMATGRVVHSDLSRDEAGKARIAWLVPIRRGGNGPPFAVVLFTLGPERFLYPFLAQWPTASRTAETLLVRRDGDRVLFLNALRFRSEAAFTLTIPLSRTEVPAVQAVLGREGISEGIDYRGEAVVAALRRIPGSPWFLVARMDKDEVEAPLRERLWNMVLLILVLVAGAGFGVGLLWRQQVQAQRFALLAVAAARDRELAVELEQRVAARTAELAAANQELESFSYSVSHDLKAPLRGIDGYSRLLEEDYGERLDAEGRAFLYNIRQGVAQMHELIEDLLAYSRMERRPLQSMALELPALVRAVVAACAAEIATAGAEVRLALPDSLVVEADREGMHLVLRNLLENALKFSRGATPPIIEIGARAEEGRAVLWVGDNGIGFDMRFHDRLFEMFSRLERAEDFPGTGVGLALVRKAMQRMGGSVRAESAPDRGATFFVEVPR